MKVGINMVPFSKRYSISNDDIESSIGEDLTVNIKRKLCKILTEFNEVQSYQPSRYDSYEIKLNMFEIVRLNWIEAFDEIEESFPSFDIDFFWARDIVGVFDFLEFWCDGLSRYEKPDFQRELNRVFQMYKTPWLVVDGKMVKIDNNFIESRVISPLIEMMENNSFSGALNEFGEAEKDLMLEDYKGAIHNACKSFESTLKTILGKSNGSAKVLVQELDNIGFFKDLPESHGHGFGDKVLMVLPFLRNRFGGHGQGEEIVELSPEYAQLAVHLAAVFNLFLIQRHISRIPKETIFTGTDEIPF